MPPPLDLAYLERTNWWAKVERGDPGECWPWLKSTGSHGYGQTWDGQTVRLAHRVAWALGRAEQVPDEMTVDHECRNRICCNPAHLRLMTNKDNASDNGPARRTHCPQGHLYDEANTYHPPSRPGHRQCRACNRDRAARHYWARVDSR